MNKIIFLALFATFATLAQTKAIQLHIEIQNPNSDSIVIHNKEFKTTLKGKNGKFSGNFEAPKGFYQLFDGAKFAQLYFSEGFENNPNPLLRFLGMAPPKTIICCRKKSTTARSEKALAANFQMRIHCKPSWKNVFRMQKIFWLPANMKKILRP